MVAANEVSEFILTINPKFEGHCNLTANKLEYIDLVENVEEHFNITIRDDVLNEIAVVQDLINETVKLLNKGEK
jgi:hypothetical protein